MLIVSKKRSKNEPCDLKISMCEININKTMEIKYYEYNFYYDGVLIKKRFRWNKKQLNHHSVFCDCPQKFLTMNLMTLKDQNYRFF